MNSTPCTMIVVCGLSGTSGGQIMVAVCMCQVYFRNITNVTYVFMYMDMFMYNVHCTYRLLLCGFSRTSGGPIMGVGQKSSD